MAGAGSEEPLVDELIEDAMGMAGDGGGDGGDGMDDDFGEPDEVRACRDYQKPSQQRRHCDGTRA